MMKALASVIAIILTLFSTALRAAEELRLPLTTARQVIELTEAEAYRLPRAEVTGVVTYANSDHNLWFIQDGTCGLYIYLDKAHQLVHGETYTFTGVARKGRHATFLNVEKVSPSEFKVTPRPLPVSAVDAASGRYDSQLLQVEGVIRGFTDNGPSIDLVLGNSIGQVGVTIPNKGLEKTKLLNARVRVVGVGATQFNGDQLIAFFMVVARPSDLQVLSPPPTPGDEPLVSIAELHGSMPWSKADHLLRTTGRLLAIGPRGQVLLSGERHSLVVRMREPISLRPGVRVELAGFLTFLEDEFILDQGEIRAQSSESKSLSQISKLDPAEPFGLAELTGQFVGLQHSSDRGPSIGFRVGHRLLRTFISTPMDFTLAELQGRQATLNGAVRWYGEGEPTKAEFWVTEPASIRLLPDQLPATSWPLYWGLLSALALGSLGLIYWRRRLPGSAEGPGSLAFSIEGRERLARDLHDGIIQSLYGIGLTIENCKNLLQSSPAQAETRLGSAVKALNGAIGQLREVISGLSTEPLKPGEFKAALKSIILTLGEASTAKIILEVDQTATGHLSSAQATHLLHIAREALSNSLRHGRPERVTIAFHKNGGGRLVFEITDDGSGFDEQTTPRGNGLRNMAGRADEINGTFSLHTRQGYGTKVTVTVSPKA